MTTRQMLVTLIVAIVGSGFWPFLQFLLKRRPEERHSDAQTTNITIQGAETTVAVLMQSLERAERREAALEAKLTDREKKIDELEDRLDRLSRKLQTVTADLDAARRELSALRD